MRMRNGQSPDGHLPARAIARMNYGLLHTNALLAFCIVNLIHSCHSDVTEPIHRMYDEYAKEH